MTVPAKIIAAKIRFSDFLKKFFSSRFNLFLFILTALFTFYYAFKVQERFDRYKIASNDTKNAVYVDVSEGKTFSIPIKTDKLQQITLMIQAKDAEREISDNDIVIQFSEIEKGFYHVFLEHNADGEGLLKVYFPYLGWTGLKNKNLNVKVSSENMLLKVNQREDLIYKQYGPNNFRKIISCLVFLFFVCFACFFVYKTRNLKTYNRVFFFTLFWGTLHLFMRPPLSTFDAIVHFDSAYNMSNIIMGEGDARKTGVFLKRECDLNLFPNAYILGHENAISYRSSLVFLKHNLLKKTSRKLVKVEPYDFLLPPQRAHFISALCITLVRILRLNQFVLYYFSAFVNLLVSTLLIRFGLKKNNQMCGNVINCICLFPTVFVQLGSFTYDTMLIALSFTVINYTLFIYFSSERKYKDIFILVFFEAILFPIKYIYFPITEFVFLLFFFDMKKKDLRNKILLMLLIIFFILLVLLYLKPFPFLLHRGMNHGVYTESVFDIITHPIKLVGAIIKAICENDFYTGGENFGGFFCTTPVVPKLLETFFLFSLFLLCFTMQKNKNIAISSFIVFIIVFVEIYLVSLMWSPVVDFLIPSGLQSRYFIPVLPLLFYSVAYFVPDRFHISINHILNFELILLLFYFIDRAFLIIR